MPCIQPHARTRKGVDKWTTLRVDSLIHTTVITAGLGNNNYDANNTIWVTVSVDATRIAKLIAAMVAPRSLDIRDVVKFRRAMQTQTTDGLAEVIS
jgi:hypothetical protein